MNRVLVSYNTRTIPYKYRSADGDGIQQHEACCRKTKKQREGAFVVTKPTLFTKDNLVHEASERNQDCIDHRCHQDHERRQQRISERVVVLHKPAIKVAPKTVVTTAVSVMASGDALPQLRQRRRALMPLRQQWIQVPQLLLPPPQPVSSVERQLHSS
jgi:hypothetical protein